MAKLGRGLWTIFDLALGVLAGVGIAAIVVGLALAGALTILLVVTYS